MASHYGNISKVDTTGASEETARADGRSSSGVSASQEMAASDLPYIDKHKDKIMSAANRHGVEPAVVAGIISRETRGGRGAGLDGGWGDHGNAYGLMQVDKRWHEPRGGWDSEEHISQGIDVFKGSYSDIEGRHPSWSKEQKLKGALSAYNMGAGSVDSYGGVDARTTGRDYANDVTARSQYFKKHGYN
ncbi:lysozyme g-like [Centroberyx affinis]|uniref:lysozyme g-like n=1 Tax=Centroberyx affinis TaxID=166261 RepID=UPI003A5BC87E